MRNCRIFYWVSRSCSKISFCLFNWELDVASLWLEASASTSSITSFLLSFSLAVIYQFKKSIAASRVAFWYKCKNVTRITESHGLSRKLQWKREIVTNVDHKIEKKKENGFGRGLRRKYTEQRLIGKNDQEIKVIIARSRKVEPIS